MKKTKIVLSIVTALMILSFVFGAGLAQDEPPTRALPDVSQYTPRVDEDAFPTNSVVVDGGPSQKVAPISPAYEFVYTRTPKFYFVRDFRAELYQIQVLDSNTSAKVYSFKGAGTCEGLYCYLQPTDKLKNLNYFGGGEYEWSVRARVGGIWEPAYNPSYAPFLVISPGFSSTFDTNMNKWYEAHGDWALKNGFLKTDGTTFAYASAFHRDIFYNYDLTAVMKRKFNPSNTSGVLVGGDPYPLYGTPKTWSHSLFFQFTNSKGWSLYEYNSGVFGSIASGTSNAIKPYDWNKLRITVFYNYIDLWINDTYIGWVDYPGANFGVVGVDMFRSNMAKEPLLVDSVRLTSITYPPMADRDPATQLGLAPAELMEDLNTLSVPADLGDSTGTR